MIKRNNCSVNAEDSPEFIMVNFNEKGQPIATRSIKDPTPYEEGNGITHQIYSTAKPVVQSTPVTTPVVSAPVVNRETIRRLLFFFIRNIDGLKEEIRQSNYDVQQALQNITLPDQNQLSDSLLKFIEPLEQKIDNLGKWAGLQNEYNKKMKMKLDTLNIYFEDLSNKMSQLKNVNVLGEKLADMNLKISYLTNEITCGKTHEMETTENLKLFSKKILSLNEQIQNQRIENQQIKEDLLVNQENITKDVLSKIQKMLKKTKKRQIKPQKAKVIRFLKKNFLIDSFNEVLVLTDKRNSTFGKILHESIRKINENSIFIVTENRKEGPVDRSIVEAIKKADYVFIIGKYPIIEIKEISETLKNRVKIISINRSLKFSIL